MPNPFLLRSAGLIVLLLAFIFAPVVRSAPSTTSADPVLVNGLQVCVSNGIDSGVRAWYGDRPEIGAEMSARVVAATHKLGDIIDSEVVAVQSVSKRVTRYYVALYFARAPLWIRIERYESRDKSFYLPLKCSTNPDEILPGYITDFLR